jgi:hypothetical protein
MPPEPVNYSEAWARRPGRSLAEGEDAAGPCEAAAAAYW